MIFDEYAEYTAKYKGEYGEATVVLMEVGSFWELYDCNARSGADMIQVCSLLNIQLSRKNKSVAEVSRNNPLMAGFPSHALQRFLPMLLENNYTVVLVGQVTPPPNPKRAVTQIISKGTVLNEVDSMISNNNSTFYIEGSKHNQYRLGFANIDVVTGSVTLYETYTKSNDASFIFDEINRLYLIFRPQEISLIGSCDSNVAEIVKLSKLPSKIKVYDMLEVYNRQVNNINFQNAMIKHCYNITSFLSPVEYIECEKRPLCTIALTFLIDFLCKHNRFLIEKLQFPEFLEESRYLSMGYNTLDQLEVDLLTSHLNRCKTAPGKRAFDKRIRNPITQIDQLEEMYNHVEMFRSQGIGKIEEVRNKVLASVHDLDRINRRIITKRLNPQEIASLHRSLVAIDQLSLEPEVTHALLDHLTSRFDIDACAKYNLDEISESLFPSGNHQEIDNLQAALSSALLQIEAKAAKLNEQFKGYFRLESNDRDGYYLLVTTKRFQEVKDKISACIGGDKIAAHTSTQASYTKLVTEEIKRQSLQITQTRQALAHHVKEQYMVQLSELEAKFADQLAQVSRTVATYDCNLTVALNSIEYNYCRPKLHATEGSFVELMQVRHPIVERIGTDSSYVANDISLNKDQPGILLYGLNAAGKSTLMKAIGISILLAQAGMYVPAASMNLSPYHNLFSRMSKNDDLQRGQSTFMIEVAELRNIIKRSNNRTIVIGDEVCSGTESTSALAIIAATLKRLITCDSNFLFATHLHDLTKMDEVKEIKSYHLHVEYDNEKEELIYHRVLRPGQGSTIYGIEVCRALKMDEQFISAAIQIRNRLTGNSHNMQQSSYNHKVYTNRCELCNLALASDVHHIKYQSHADASGFVGHTFVHSKENLIGVCDACHNKVHGDQIHIAGKVATSSGVKVDHQVNCDEPMIKPEHIACMQTMRYEKKDSYAKIKNQVMSEFGLLLSIYKIKKLLS